MQVAIIGYGLSGRFFHAPLIAATDGLEVKSVVTSNPARRRQVRAVHPGSDLVVRVGELWSGPRADLIVVASANDAHSAIASVAIEHSVPVVVD